MTISLGTGTAAVLVMLVAKATLLLLAALGASLLLQRASAGARHLVWVAIVGALLLLPAFVKWTPLKLAILPPAAAPVASLTPKQSITPNGVANTPPGVQPNAASATLPSPAGNAAASQERQPMSPWRIAAIVWGVIAVAVSAWLAFGFVSVRRIVRRAQVLEDRLWTRPLYEIADRLGIDATPRLMRSDDVRMPFACGLVTPTIVLPADSEDWDLERRRAVLMHELAHIRRKDLLGHTIGRLACAVYWFHPLVWTAVRRMRIESERACDDLALTCGLRATTYAEHLLDIVTAVGKSRTPAVAIPMAHRREFEGRMLAILDPALRRGLGRAQSFALVMGLAALVLVVGAAVPAPRSMVLATNAVAPSDTVIPSDTANAGTEVHLTSTRTQAATGRQESKQTLSSPTPSENQKETDVEAAPAAVGAEVLREFTAAELSKLTQDTARGDRAGLLITVLRSDTSATLRRVAAWGLSNHADRSDVGAALATALRRDSNADVREMSAWALAHGNDRKEVIDALSEAVRRDADADVRDNAAWALGNLGAEGAVDALTEALGAPSPQLRAVAMWALGNLNISTAPRGVLTALSDSSKRVRMLAAWALFRLEDPESVDALEAALNRENDRELRMAYIRALGAIGEKSSTALARLIDSKEPDVRAVVVEALAGKGGGPWPWPWPRPRPSP